jgi:hypothetical protein
MRRVQTASLDSRKTCQLGCLNRLIQSDHRMHVNNCLSTTQYSEIFPNKRTKGVSSGIRDIILPGYRKNMLNQVVEVHKLAEVNPIKRREETTVICSLHHAANMT